MISIHAPLRGRRQRSQSPRVPRRFQSTPPCGGDRSGSRPRWWAWNFNPRPLAGATGVLLHAGRNLGNFNPRPLAGATTSQIELKCGFYYFNPRPLAGATELPGAVDQLWAISIHAPLRGRPGDFWMTADEAAISIHAPLRGRLHFSGLPALPVSQFQSTPPCGGDELSVKLLSERQHFNPRPLAGATYKSRCFSMYSQFQSTPPCGGDAILSKRFFKMRYFNPRPLAGATRRPCFRLPPLPDFNPRPLAGATEMPTTKPCGKLFQSTPPCGGDPRPRCKKNCGT